MVEEEPRKQRDPWGSVQQNPFTSPPNRPTLKYRIRGKYAPSELVFLREELTSRGYTITNSDNDWDIMWTIRMLQKEFRLLAPFQKVNFMPGLHEICRKDLLHRSINELRKKSEHLHQSDKDFEQELARCEFWPVGFNLDEPAQLDAFEKILAQSDSDPESWFIIKKPFSSCGRGVVLVQNSQQFEEVNQISFVVCIFKRFNQ